MIISSDLDLENGDSKHKKISRVVEPRTSDLKKNAVVNQLRAGIQLQRG